jgi:hypothetical protein
MQPTIHKQEKPDIYRPYVQVYVSMYCGLHFLFRRAYYITCEIPCIKNDLQFPVKARRVSLKFVTFVFFITPRAIKMFLNARQLFYVLYYKDEMFISTKIFRKQCK